jgi:gamma-glutamyltranspeptidase/glutathione hydrolase
MTGWRWITAAVLAGILAMPAAADDAERAVATAHPLATDAAEGVLAEGGNAFDAAVAASAALAVVEPTGSGLGGGGFWLLHDAGATRSVMVDGRETAPARATETMYQAPPTEAYDEPSLNGPLAAGIPGEPAALAHIAETYGQLSLARSLAPAIKLAREGFRVDDEYRDKARFRREVLMRYPASRRLFLDDGQIPEAGWRLRQPELARTLERLAEQGRSGFYRGKTAARLISAVQEAGGIWQRKDLHDYAIVEREPVTFDYRDYQITAASLPSAGGVGLATMLGILEGVDRGAIERTGWVHWQVEAMRRAYRDRARHLGDPDFTQAPVERLTSRAYAEALRSAIDPDEATPSKALNKAKRGRDTTHFSIVDAQGNRVAATLSINYPFGSGFVAEGTGVVLNDEMNDFATDPGEPNAYGLVGGEANAIRPGKRPLSSMTPTFVEGPDRTAVLGTPGGSRIITMVLLGILEFTDGGDADAMVSRPRYHHQYLPDVIEHEPGAFPTALRRQLRQRGHELKVTDRRFGDMQVIVRDRDTAEAEAASDPRGRAGD